MHAASSGGKTDPGRAGRLLIVDDHDLVRKTLRQYIESCTDWVVCAEAGSGGDALAAARAHRPDVVLLDLGLPDGTALDFIEALHRARCGIRILILSLHSEGLYAEASLRAGANGYLMKSEAPNHLVQALSIVQAGGTYMSRRLRARYPRAADLAHTHTASPDHCVGHQTAF